MYLFGVRSSLCVWSQVIANVILVLNSISGTNGNAPPVHTKKKTCLLSLHQHWAFPLSVEPEGSSRRFNAGAGRETGGTFICQGRAKHILLSSVGGDDGRRAPRSDAESVSMGCPPIPPQRDSAVGYRGVFEPRWLCSTSTTTGQETCAVWLGSVYELAAEVARFQDSQPDRKA